MMHEPVLLKEVIKILDLKPGDFVIDGTVDGGGHALELIERIKPGGIFLGIDWDEKMIKKLTEKIDGEKTGLKKVVLVADNYANLGQILREKNLGKANAILLDLGFSSEQLEDGKGFSFQKDEPLIMTYSKDSKPACQVLREKRELELAGIIKEYGEERFALKISRAIKDYLKSNRIITSKKLADIISQAVPVWYRRMRIHPATRTFQALRIYVNQELENLERFLKECTSFLMPGGKLAIISFHSLEDRLVKNYFRDFSKKQTAMILTKKPITSSKDEIYLNPRSRSAKLRAINIF